MVDLIWLDHWNLELVAKWVHSPIQFLETFNGPSSGIRFAFLLFAIQSPISTEFDCMLLDITKLRSNGLNYIVGTM